jgi:hypothetical protein
MAEIKHISDILGACAVYGANVPILMVLSAATVKLLEKGMKLKLMA